MFDKLFKKLKNISIIDALIILIIIVLIVLFIFPIIFVLFGSLKSGAELSESLRAIISGNATKYIDWTILPKYPTLQHFVEILFDSPGYFVMFWNSMKIVLAILLGQLLVGLPCAWGFSQLKFKHKNKLFSLYIFLMLLPFQVLMLSEYLVINTLGMLDTLWALIIPAAFSTFPVFIMYYYFNNINPSVIEAAKLDGASSFKTFIYIAIPIGRAGIISALVISFLEYWNMIEQPLTFISDKSKWPLSLYLPEITSKNIGGAFVVSLLTMLPPILVFLCLEKYLEKGIATINQ